MAHLSIVMMLATASLAKGDDACGLLQTPRKDVSRLHRKPTKLPELYTQGVGAALHAHVYSLLFDAGSSGTRLKMYFQSNLTEVKPNTTDKAAFKGPGFDDFSSEPCAAVTEIERMLKAAEAYIPKAQRVSTPVWLRATGGVRLMAPDSADDTVACINDKLSKPGATSFSWQDAEIASGDIEAVYESVTVNIGVERSSEYVGSMGLGGASMQMAFVPANPILNNEFVYYTETEPVQLYAKSYMRFGQDQGLVRSFQQLFKTALNGSLRSECKEIAHPCLLTGYQENRTADGSPCGKEVGGENRCWTFYGTSQSEQCKQLNKELMLDDVECMMGPCAMVGVYQTALSGKFKAHSAFYYLVSALELVSDDESKVVSPGQIADSTQEFCNQTYAEIVEQGDTEHTRYVCFNGWFSYSMLKSMHFSNDSGSIEFIPDVSWTVGALEYLTRYNPRLVT